MNLPLLTPYIRFLRALALRDRPVYVHFAVTNRCNLRCRSCVIWERGKTMPELGLGEIQRLARVVADLGCAQVSLGGGEPAMREDLPDIVAAFQRHHIRVRVLSNGVAMTPHKAQRLLDAGLREFSFSLDSLEPQIQDEMDNRAGTFAQRMENLLALAEMLPARGSLPMLNTVLTHQNFRQALDIADFAEELGFFISFIPIHLASDGGEHRFYTDAPFLRFRPEDEQRLREIYGELIARKLRGRRIINSTSFLQRSPDYLLSGQASWPCRAGELFLSVSPDGKVSPCHAFEGDWAFDFREFSRIFHSKEYRAQLQQRVPHCEGCLRPCWAEMGFLLLEPRGLLEMIRTQALARRGRPKINKDRIRAKLGLGND